MEPEDDKSKEVHISWGAPIAEKEKLYLENAKRFPKRRHFYLNQLCHNLLNERMYKKLWKYIELCMECATTDEELAEDYYMQWLYWNYQEKHKESLPALIKAVELEKTGEWIGHLGRLYIDLGDFAMAQKTYERLLTMKDEEGERDYQEEYETYMADLFGEMKDMKKANKLFNKMLKEAKDDHRKAQIYSSIAEMYLNAEDLKSAISNGEKAVKHNGEYAYISRLGYLYKEAKNFEKAEAAYNLTLALIEKDGNNKLYLQTHYCDDMAELNIAMGNKQEAIRWYEKKAEYEKSHPVYDTLKELCALHFDQRQFMQCEPYLIKMMELWPGKYPRVYTSMGAISLEERNDAENALNYFLIAKQILEEGDKIAEDDDAETRGMVYGFLGKLYYQEFNDIDAAVMYYEKALEYEAKKSMVEHICDSLYTIYTERGEIEKAKAVKEKRSPITQMKSILSGDWTPPPPKSLEDRLRDRQNTDEEMKNLPYHHSKIPKQRDIVAKSDFLKQMHLDLEDDLLNNPKYQEYWAEHDPYYNRGFIRAYALHKKSLIENHKYYYDGSETVHNIILNNETEQFIELILQKKLFNKQLLWRAEQISIPEIKISDDFNVWEHDIFDCRFIEPVTREEIELMKEYILRPGFSEGNNLYLSGFQDYEAIMEKDEDGGEPQMPEWYEFYDSRMNTGGLKLLPDIRGKKERDYVAKYWAWKNRQPPEPPPAQVPQRKVLPGLHGMDDHYTEFMEIFENDYLCNLHQNYLNAKIKPDSQFEREDVEQALHILEYADEQVPIEASDNWQEAVINAARKYKSKQFAGKLDEVYADYLMKLELNIPHYDEDKMDNYSIGHSETKLNFILKAREVNGEPRDLNF